MPEVGIVGDCRLVTEELVAALEAAGLAHDDRGGRADAGATGDAGHASGAPPVARGLVGPAAGLADASSRSTTTRTPRAPVKPQMVVETLRDLSPADTVVVAGVGQHQMWASQYWRFDHPYTWVNSGGAGTMGFAVPAAIGAKVGRPDKTVWAIDGDGCFQMTAQELVTASAERIPVKVAILNNAYLGMVRQWQEMFYAERYSEVYLSPDLPDYVKWAEAMGCVGHPGRDARGGGAGHREGQRDRRPAGGRRLPDRRLREGVPDGAGRRLQRRHRRAPRPTERPDRAMTDLALRAARRRGARHHILSVLVENKAGVLARVAGLFSRRGFNIFSLAVAPTDDERLQPPHHRGRRRVGPLEQVIQQLDKLINVVSISQLAPEAAVERELLLATVAVDAARRGEVIELVGVFGGEVVERRARPARR